MAWRIDTHAVARLAVKENTTVFIGFQQKGEAMIDCSDYASLYNPLMVYQPGDLDEQIRQVKEEVRDAKLQL